MRERLLLLAMAYPEETKKQVERIKQAGEP